MCKNVYNVYIQICSQKYYQNSSKLKTTKLSIDIRINKLQYIHKKKYFIIVKMIKNIHKILQMNLKYMKLNEKNTVITDCILYITILISLKIVSQRNMTHLVFLFSPNRRGIIPWGLLRQLTGLRVHLPMQEIQEMWVKSLGGEDPLEKEMETHCNILA